MRVVDIIEARMTSTRLPGKVLKEVQGKPLLQHMVERLQRSNLLDDIVIATTTNPSDDVIESLANKIGVPCYRGSEDDVLQRVLDAAHENNVDVIVETPGDCPMIDWEVLDNVIAHYLNNDYDYVSNNLELTYPGGLDVQVFSTKTLEDVNKRTSSPVDHEHVSLFIYRNQHIYNVDNVNAPNNLNYPDIKFLLDTPDDLKLITEVYNELYPIKPKFKCIDLIDLVKNKPVLQEINKSVERTKV